MFIIFRLLVALFLMTLSSVYGEEGPVGLPSMDELRHDFADRQEHFMSEFMNMLFMLGVILFFILAIAWLARRLLNARMAQVNQTSGVKIIERRVLGPKSTIYVLEVSGVRLVVGETPMGLTSLGQVPKEDESTGPRSFSKLMEKQ